LAPDSSDWAQFLRKIDASYQATDNDRYTLERALTVSSDEMQVLYQKLKSSCSRESMLFQDETCPLLS